MNHYKNQKPAMINNTLRSKVLALLLLASVTVLQGQAIIFSMDTVITQPGQEVTVGVYTSGLNNVGAISLYIGFNINSLVWIGAENWHPSIDNAYNMANASGSTVGIVWFDVNPVTTGPIKLLDLRFQFTGNQNPLFFTGACEVTTGNGTPVSPTPIYQNGLVARQMEVTATSNKIEFCPGGSAILSANISGGLGASTVQWASSPPGFTSTLMSPTVFPTVTTRYFVTATEGFYTDTSSVLISISPSQPTGALGGMIPADSTIGLGTSITFSWQPAANATKYDFYVWKDGQAMPSNPIVPNITSISTLYQGLAYETKYHWKIVAKNDCYSRESPVQTFSTLALPDLHVTNVSHSFSKSGQTIQISWTVRNDGNGPTTEPVWYDRIWIAPDIEVRIGEPEDILLATYPNPIYLAPGQSYTQNKLITLPSNLIGTYFIFVVTDALDALFINPGPGGFQIPYSPPPYLMAFSHSGYGVNLVKEASDSPPYHDNFYYTPVTFPVPPLPDLRVSTVAAPISSFSGQSITVNWRVDNYGSASTPQTAWQDRIFLSGDDVLDDTDVLLKTVQHINRLDPDSGYQTSTTVTLPNYISGPFFILVYTDALDVVYEHAFDENNVSASDTVHLILTPPPDLVVTYITVSDTVSNAHDVVIKWTVQNQGATPPIVTSWSDKIYLSTTPDLNSATAIDLGSKIITMAQFQPGQTYTDQRVVRIPTQINGPYYLFIHTDYNNKVFENLGDTNNITRRNPAIIVISPDLSPLSITPPSNDSTGKSFLLQWTTQNLGPGGLQNQSWNERVFISQTPIYQPSISLNLKDSRKNLAIPAGGSIAISDSIKVPHQYVEGTYFLHIFSDAASEVFENGQESNNISTQAASLQVVRPDLTVSRIQMPFSGSSGLPVSLSWTVKNVGSGIIQHSWRRDQVWLSKTPTYSPDSVISLGVFNQSTHLGSQDSIIVQQTMVIPNGISGYYYLMVYTDILDAIPEGNRYGNNRMISTERILIDLSPWPDLMVDTFMVNDTLTAGVVELISFRVKNSGNAIAQGAAWTDRLYISSSSAWNANQATSIGSSLRSLQIEPDSTYLVSFNANLPTNLSSGYYYFYAMTDEGNVIFEHTDEDNNRSRSTARFIKPYPINLAMTAASFSGDTVSSGQNIVLNWTVDNLSAVPTSTLSWYDAIYLSADTLFDPSIDTYIGRWDVNGPLNPGQNYQRARQISIPYGVNGNRYLILRNDYLSNIKDIDYSDNHRLLVDGSGNPTPLYINELPSPDLVVTQVEIPTQVFAGQPFKAYWTVRNQGAGAVSNTSVSDVIFLSTDFQISSGDIQLGVRTRILNLLPGDSIRDSLTITITVQTTANYLVLFKTDHTDKVYEHNAEHNNVTSAYLAVAVAPPSDLMVMEVNCPDTMVVGAQVNFEWIILNQGVNTAFGNVTDALYISTDSLLDNSDLLFAQYNAPLNLSPGATSIRNTLSEIPGMAEGLYYIIVSTDAKNNINESDDGNNNTSSFAKLIMMKRLYIDQLQLDTVTNGEFTYYKLDLHDSLLGETVLITMKGDSIRGNNEMFIARDRAPSKLDYDRRSPYNFSGNQDVVLPEVMDGEYYLMVTGLTSPGQQQKVTILAKKVNFEVRLIDPKRGGNEGNVTVRIDGSKFEPGMLILLNNPDVAFDDLGYLHAFNIHYVDPSLVFASFALHAGEYIGDDHQRPMTAGIYDLMLIKPGTDTLIIEDAFEIYNGGIQKLLVNIIHPPNVRPNRYVSMSIQYANGGDIDIPVPGYSVMSMFGAPIGFSTDQLNYGLTDVYVEFKDPFGPPGVLRPGAASTITLFTISSHRLVFKLIPFKEQ